MMLQAEANLRWLAGGLHVKARVQHPQVKPRKDRDGWPWVFRYRADEVRPDGGVKTRRKYQALGPSKGDRAISKKQAEIERDKFLAKLNAPTTEAAVEQIAATGVALFGEVAKMYEDGYLARENQISKPTREKEQFYLQKYIVPKWGRLRLNQFQPQAVEDWLHTTFDSWWTKHGVRAIMIRIYKYAEGYGLWEEGRRSPVSKAKLGKKQHKYERRIPSFEETARVLARLEEPYKLVVETCIMGHYWWRAGSSKFWASLEARELQRPPYHQASIRPTGMAPGGRSSRKTDGSRRVLLGIGRFGRVRHRAKGRRGLRPHPIAVCVPAEAGARRSHCGIPASATTLHQGRGGRGLCHSSGLGPHFVLAEPISTLAAAGRRQRNRGVQDCRAQRPRNDRPVHLRRARAPERTDSPHQGKTLRHRQEVAR